MSINEGILFQEARFFSEKENRARASVVGRKAFIHMFDGDYFPTHSKRGIDARLQKDGSFKACGMGIHITSDKEILYRNGEVIAGRTSFLPIGIGLAPKGTLIAILKKVPHILATKDPKYTVGDLWRDPLRALHWLDNPDFVWERT